MRLLPTNFWFSNGSSRLHSRRKTYNNLDQHDLYSMDEHHHQPPSSEYTSSKHHVPPQPGSLTHFLFGFMYEEDTMDDDDDDESMYFSSAQQRSSIWNPLNAALFCALMSAAFATSVPVALTARMNADLGTDAHATSFAPRAAAAAVLGTAVGKIVTAPLGDMVGARRTILAFSFLLSLSLALMAASVNLNMATYACFLVEFTYSVQWPCCIITLATHYRGNSSGMYEGGIYITSLGSRVGSLVGIPACSLLLRRLHWRVVALIGAWVALVGASVSYLYVHDSPTEKDAPQNPVDHLLLEKWFPDYYRRKSHLSFGTALKMGAFIIQSNVIPSVKHVLLSGTFWIVALAHTGASVVRTSERVLGSYLYATSNETLSENRAAGLAVFMSIGTVLGLMVAGNLFASHDERQRKWLVSRLYMITISACYILALLSVPSLRYTVNAPTLITIFQVFAVVAAGFGIAVQFYHIPSLVGATFGCDKGLFSSYTDGVAYGIASVVWTIVGDVVQHGNSDGGSWFYGWAAVALILIPSAILMVEFMEHYFCRHHSAGGKLETILIA
jgi:MFS family permease